MLERYEDVITNIPWGTDLVVHDIVLKDKKLVFTKPYCLPLALRAQVKQEIENMKSAGIIENAQRPRVAPVVCVPKKDNILRFYVDYSSLISSASNKVIWTDEHQQAFDMLKMAITSYMALRNPDFTKTFTIQMDGRDRGIGGVLLQVTDGKKLPILFISKKLLARERLYSTIEKECLAIVRCMSQLREYLEGKEFIQESDHYPLQ